RFDALSRSGCIVCRIVHGVITPANIHHATGIKYRATGKKASDDHVLPLCHFHHQGQQGIHTIGMRTWEAMFGTQEYLMELSNTIIAEQY
ncbi:MAG TPA: hypothetical protein VFM18_03095, partial [Methanosarcina sp.]|nr:hypothetical protein [Methanosarcina sp.]